MGGYLGCHRADLGPHVPERYRKSPQLVHFGMPGLYAYVKQFVQFTAPVLYLLITGLDASLALALRWVEAPAL